jgi:hypothetical protein
MFYTIQRLMAPSADYAAQFNAASSTFAARGLDVFPEIFEADYMGNSSFEWGALRRALIGFVEMAALGKIQAKVMSVEALHSHTEIKDRRIKGKQTERTILTEDFSDVKDVYTLAPKDLEQDLEAFLKLAAQGHMQTAEFTAFREALFTPEIRTMVGRKGEVFADRFKGWFDLDSASFFFRDRAMFEKLALASGITPEA